MEATATMMLLAASYAILFALERAFPLRRAKTALLPRLGVNAAISALAFATAAALVRPAAGAALAFDAQRSFGVMPLLGLHGAAEIAVAFLLMDLTFYYWHVANHRLPVLWRMHVAHHLDPDLDVSTGFRFHFAEVALSAAFRALQVLLVGPSLTAFAVYEVAFQICTLFHHSNLRLPVRLERKLNAVLVTPRMHGVHHSDRHTHTDSNFGVVFTWWDRLHGTLELDVRQEITIGIPAFSHAGDNRLLHCFALPFLRQPDDYWSREAARRNASPRR